MRTLIDLSQKYWFAHFEVGGRPDDYETFIDSHKQIYTQALLEDCPELTGNDSVFEESIIDLWQMDEDEDPAYQAYIERYQELMLTKIAEHKIEEHRKQAEYFSDLGC